MTTAPAIRAHALRQAIDFDRYRTLRARPAQRVREYRIVLTAWCAAEVWVKGVDQHDAEEAAHLLWGCGHDNLFTHTDGGIHDLKVLESRQAE